jgi:hypothetical protein
MPHERTEGVGPSCGCETGHRELIIVKLVDGAKYRCCCASAFILGSVRALGDKTIEGQKTNPEQEK